MMRLRLLTRPGCHLCDAMKVVVDRLASDYDITLETVDITGDRRLERRYGNEIPVLLRGDDVVATGRTTEPELRARLGS